MIEGAAAAWLEGSRTDLNRRYERARERWPRLDAGTFAARLEAHLPLLAPFDRQGTLLGELYGLLLLHAGRDSFSRQPALETLFGEVFPRLGPLLGRSPSLLPALSNAVEGAGEAAPSLALAFGALGSLVESPAELLDAGAVAAWRLGKARLREAALRVGRTLPPRALLAALLLPDWPDAAAPLALAALEGDAWRHPREALASGTLSSLDRAAPGERARLGAALLAPQPAPLGIWKVAARAGEFSGFGGSFDAPPLLVGAEGRHRFLVSSAGEPFVVDADCFGWSCRRLPGPEAGTPPPANRWTLRVLPDGTLTDGREKAPLPSLAGASSSIPFPRGIACTLQTSHRIRIVVPRSFPL